MNDIHKRTIWMSMAVQGLRHAQNIWTEMGSEHGQVFSLQTREKMIEASRAMEAALSAVRSQLSAEERR